MKNKYILSDSGNCFEIEVLDETEDYITYRYTGSRRTKINTVNKATTSIKFFDSPQLPPIKEIDLIRNELKQAINLLDFSKTWIEIQVAIEKELYHDQPTLEEDIQDLIDQGIMPSGYYEIVKFLENNPLANNSKEE